MLASGVLMPHVAPAFAVYAGLPVIELSTRSSKDFDRWLTFLAERIDAKANPPRA